MKLLKDALVSAWNWLSTGPDTSVPPRVVHVEPITLTEGQLAQVDSFVRETLRRHPELVASESHVTEPPLGLLVSMAMRADHGLFYLGLLNSTYPEIVNGMRTRLEHGLTEARRQWEEVTGNGFWSPERNAEYEKMYHDAMETLNRNKST